MTVLVFYYPTVVKILIITRLLSKFQLLPDYCQNNKKGDGKVTEIPAFFGAYMYNNYDQLRRLKRDYPKRLSTHTPSGIPCEYYTMPRNIFTKPAGYTPYTAHQIYDVNHAEELVRVSIRVPKYIDNGGNIHEETIAMPNGKYTHDALNLLHQKFRNPAWSYDNLQKAFPLGSNATKDAYEVLLPWARKNNVFPHYPAHYSHLWFIAVPYKESTLTFCTYAYVNDEEPSDWEFSLFDVLVDENFETLNELKRCAYGTNKKAFICMPANYTLYKILHDILPNATYVFDEFQLLTITEKCADEIPTDAELFLSKRTDVLAIQKELYYKKCSPQKARSVCYPVIRFLKDYILPKNLDSEKGKDQDYPKRNYLDSYKKSLNLILKEQSYFIDNYFNIDEFHLFIPFQIKASIKLFLKQRGYAASRLAYMILSNVTNLPYVEPAAQYCIIPVQMVKEEPTLYGEADKHHDNSLISSVLRDLNWMSTGEFIY